MKNRKGGAAVEGLCFVILFIILNLFVRAMMSDDRLMDLTEYKDGIIIEKNSNMWWYGENVRLLHDGEITKTIMIYEITANELTVGDTIQ